MWGNPFLLQHGRKWERLLTDNEVEVAWERVGKFQGESMPAGFVGILICCGGGTGCGCPRTVQAVPGHPQPVPPPGTAAGSVRLAESSRKEGQGSGNALLTNAIATFAKKDSMRHSGHCAEQTWRPAVYFWEVNLGLWDTPAFLKGRFAAWVFPLKGKQSPFLSSFCSWSYTTLGST